MAITSDRVNRHLSYRNEKDFVETKRSTVYTFEGCVSPPYGGRVHMVKCSGKAAQLYDFTVADPGFFGLIYSSFLNGIPCFREDCIREQKKQNSIFISDKGISCTVFKFTNFGRFRGCWRTPSPFPTNSNFNRFVQNF